MRLSIQFVMTRKKIPSVVLILLVLLVSLTPWISATDCGVSDTSWAAFYNYLGWLAKWRGKNYLAESGTTQIAYARDEDRSFWFLASFKLLVGYSPSRQPQVFSSTCEADPAAWTGCIPPSDQPGRTLVIADVCRTDRNRSDFPQWQPSPDSVQKHALLTKIQAAVREVSYPGDESVGKHIASLLVSDFNVLDPMVWAVADVKHSSGSQMRLLITMGINSAAPMATLVKSEPQRPDNKEFFEKVLASAVKLQ